MKIDFRVVDGEIEDFVDDLKTFEYILCTIYQGGKNKGKPFKRREVLKYLDMSELEVFNFIKNQNYSCIIRPDRYDQAFPGEDLFHLTIYNGFLE